MNRTIEFELNGQTYHLLCNASAIFDCYEHFDSSDLLTLMTGMDRASCDGCIWMLCKFSQQGELLRRYQGEDRGLILKVEEVTRTLSPVDMIRARRALRAAYYAGLTREQTSEDEDEIDEGLLELQKKKGLASRLRAMFT